MKPGDGSIAGRCSIWLAASCLVSTGGMSGWWRITCLAIGNELFLSNEKQYRLAVFLYPVSIYSAVTSSGRWARRRIIFSTSQVFLDVRSKETGSPSPQKFGVSLNCWQTFRVRIFRERGSPYFCACGMCSYPMVSCLADLTKESEAAAL